MEKAVMYIRVSTEQQDYERQISELTRYAAYKQLEIVSIFEEKISGTTKGVDRLQFNSMLEYISNKDNNIKHVLVWELSRLGRNTIDLLNNINTITDVYNVNIFMLKENINVLDGEGKRNSFSNFMLTILGAVATMERETFLERSKSGIRQAVQNGKVGTGYVKAYGYANEDKMLIINEEEAETVKLIYQLCLDGLGTERIAKFLNEKGIKTKYSNLFDGDKVMTTRKGRKWNVKDGVWAAGTVYSILTNSIYCGERKHKGEVFKCPQIIDSVTYNQVQEKLKAGTNKKDTKRKYTNYFSDIIICGCCNSSYYMHKRADNKDNAYKCLSKRKLNDIECNNPSINIDKLNELIYVLFFKNLNQQQNSNINKNNAELEGIERDITLMQADIRKVESAIERLLQTRLDGTISTELYNINYAKLNESLKQKKQQLKRLQIEHKQLNEALNKLADTTIEHLTLDEAKPLFKNVVKKITVIEIPQAEQHTYTSHSDFKNDVAVRVKIESVDNNVFDVVMLRWSKSILFTSYVS